MTVSGSLGERHLLRFSKMLAFLVLLGFMAFLGTFAASVGEGMVRGRVEQAALTVGEEWRLRVPAPLLVVISQGPKTPTSISKLLERLKDGMEGEDAVVQVTKALFAMINGEHGEDARR